MSEDIAASVVVVTYNHERFLAQALDSILGQRTQRPFEVIVSEDCSSDGTRAIALDYAARHPGRVRALLSDRNLNSNEVGSRGLRAATGGAVRAVKLRVGALDPEARGPRRATRGDHGSPDV